MDSLPTCPTDENMSSSSGQQLFTVQQYPVSRPPPAAAAVVGEGVGGEVGVAVIEITYEPLSTEKLAAELCARNREGMNRCGAVSTFAGTTRCHHDGKAVQVLEYECYAAMAEKKMSEIVAETFRRFPLVHAVALSHRLGVVTVGECSVAIVVAAEHRDSSLDGVRYIIDTLKAVVPIWKKEVYNGSDQQQPRSAWKANAEFAKMSAALGSHS